MEFEQRPVNGYDYDRHGSDFYIANLDEVWPRWRNPHTDTINLGVGHRAERLEPWPSEDRPDELLLWLVRSPAELWIPTMNQIHRLREKRRAATRLGGAEPAGFNTTTKIGG